MRRVLVTGGGPVSRAIATALLQRGDEVILWLHARSRGELERKQAALPLDLDEVPGLLIRGGELRDAEPFLGFRRETLTDIVHAAALTRFTVSQDEAQAVNVEGMAAVVRLARSCPRVGGILLVSSVHAAGLRHGIIDEAPFDDEAEFANWYEWSKARAETLVASSGLPWRIARLGTLVGPEPGSARPQDNALTLTLRLLHSGLLPLLPGLPGCPVHVIPAPAAGEACVALLAAPSGVYHVTTSPERAPSLGSLLRHAHERLSRDESWRRRRVPLPLLVESATFDLLVSGAEGLASPLIVDALRCLAPFARQLHAPKTFLTRAAEAASPRTLDADPLTALDITLDSLAAPRARRLAEARS